MPLPLTLRQGPTRILTLNRTRLLLSAEKKFRPSDLKELATLLDRAGLEIVRDSTHASPPKTKAKPKGKAAEVVHERKRPHRVNNSDRHVWVEVREGHLDDAIISRLRRSLRNLVHRIGAAYQASDIPGDAGLVCPLSDVLLVRSNPEVLARVIERLGAKIDAARSKWLAPYHYVRTPDDGAHSSYHLASQIVDALTVPTRDVVFGPLGDAAAAPLKGILVGPIVGQLRNLNVPDVLFDLVPFLVPEAAIPTDDGWPQNDMIKIDAPTAWDTTKGDAAVDIYVMDKGRFKVDLDDIKRGATSPKAYDLSMTDLSGNPLEDTSSTPLDHPTELACIAAAKWDNGPGIAGMAPNCNLVSLNSPGASTSEIATGITYAEAQSSAKAGLPGNPQCCVLLFGFDYTSVSMTDTMVTTALTATADPHLVVCAPIGDYTAGTGVVATGALPSASNLLVCGASSNDPIEDRVDLSGGIWGSRTGPMLSILAPGVAIEATNVLGVVVTIDGTCPATAHVAGLAALIESNNKTLTANQVRDRILRTAAKIGVTRYKTAVTGATPPRTPDPNGMRNDAVGYGRIDAEAAFTSADVYIADYPGDPGNEDNSSTAFWYQSDVCLSTNVNAIDLTDTLANQDAAFTALVPGSSSDVHQGTAGTTVDNYVFIRVHNKGPDRAKWVKVDVAIQVCATAFAYPEDWETDGGPLDTMHVVPVPDSPVGGIISAIPSGEMRIYRFKLSVDDAMRAKFAAGWGNHACALARAVAANDRSFVESNPVDGGMQALRNNLVQRNLSVIT